MTELWRKKPAHSRTDELLLGKEAEAEYWSEWKQQMQAREVATIIDKPGMSIADSLKPGVYMLIYHNSVVFVGRAKCMLSVIATHRSMVSDKRVPEWSVIKGIHFDDVIVYPMPFGNTLATMNQLIEIYKPKHNIYAGPILQVPTPTEGAAPRITRRI